MSDVPALPKLPDAHNGNGHGHILRTVITGVAGVVFGWIASTFQSVATHGQDIAVLKAQTETQSKQLDNLTRQSEKVNDKLDKLLSRKEADK